MNNPSPLVPQGSLELKNKGRARVKIAVFFVLAVHGIGLLALLMQGCHKEEPAAPVQSTNAPPVFEAPTPTNVPVEPPATTATPTTPPASPDTTPAAALSEYTVVSGDNPSTIASKFKITAKALLDANPGVEPTKLKPGQKLHIPAPAPAVASANGAATAPTTTPNGETLYTVKSGDNLTTIAQHFGTTVKAIRAANSLKTDSIKVGQKLQIPAKSSGATTPDPAGTAQPPR